MRKRIRISMVLTCLAVLLCAQRAQPQASDRAEIEKLVADYVELYAGNTLDTWKLLFHPALIVASPKADGTIQVRGLEEFFSAQKSYFRWPVFASSSSAPKRKLVRRVATRHR